MSPRMNNTNNNFNNSNDMDSMALDALLNEHEFYSQHVQKLEQAIEILQDSGGVTGGFRNSNNRTSSFKNSSSFNSRNRNQMNSSQQNKDGSPDLRTTSNRERYGSAQNISPDDLDPNNIKWDQNGESVDLRTIEGKALLADGLVDENGYPMDNFPQDWLPSNFNNIGSSGSGRNQSSSSRSSHSR